MLWHSKTELERDGRPNRKELFLALAATPLLLFQITAWSLRIVRGVQGEPLPVSTWLEIELFRSASSSLFAVGVALYLLCIVFASLLLWGCALQLQRWFYWNGRN